jgi:hypothetical protein
MAHRRVRALSRHLASAPATGIEDDGVYIVGAGRTPIGKFGGALR